MAFGEFPQSVRHRQRTGLHRLPCQIPVDVIGEFLRRFVPAVAVFFQRLHHLGRDTRAFGEARVAAVGLATSERLQAQGVHPDLVPEIQSQEGLVEAFAGISVKGRDILLPTSSIGRTFLAEDLKERGASVQRIIAYQNQPPDPEQVKLPLALLEKKLDLALFASPSSVEHLQTVVGAERTREILAQTTIACIGPTTAKAIHSLDLEVHIQPPESSMAALIQAICAHYREQRP